MKVKQMVSKGLSGQETAVLLLNDMIEGYAGQGRTYSDAECMSAYDGVAVEQYASFNKWKSLDDLLPEFRNMANTSALTAANYLQLICTRIERAKLRWLVEGCEDGWQSFLHSKQEQIGAHGLKPHIVDFFNPLYPIKDEEREIKELELVQAFYNAAIRFLKYYVACKGFAQILNELIHLDITPILCQSDHMLDAALVHYHMLVDDLSFSNHLAENHAGIESLLASANLHTITLDYEIPHHLTTTIKSNLTKASKDDLLKACKEAVEQIAEGLGLDTI